MQAAITAADRGHQVTLCEKASVLGGLLNFTDHTNHKVDIRNFKDLLIREVEKRPIDLRLNCEATPELIAELNPEAVILAVGSEDLILPIEGIENAVTAGIGQQRNRTGRRPGGLRSRCGLYRAWH